MGTYSGAPAVEGGAGKSDYAAVELFYRRCRLGESVSRTEGVVDDSVESTPFLTLGFR